MEVARYLFRGTIERPARNGRSYAWKPGYSEAGETGGELQPWRTRAECRAEAARDGRRAVFCFPEG